MPSKLLKRSPKLRRRLHPATEEIAEAVEEITPSCWGDRQSPEVAKRLHPAERLRYAIHAEVATHGVAVVKIYAQRCRKSASNCNCKLPHRSRLTLAERLRYPHRSYNPCRNCLSKIMLEWGTTGIVHAHTNPYSFYIAQSLLDVLVNLTFTLIDPAAYPATANLQNPMCQLLVFFSKHQHSKSTES